MSAEPAYRSPNKATVVISANGTVAANTGKDITARNAAVCQ